MAGTFKLAVNNVCPVHDQDLLYFCSAHDEVLCRDCVKTEHQKCPPPVAVAEVAKKSKVSVSTNVEGNFKIILENLKNALDHQRKTLSNVSDKQAEIKRQIQEVRNKLNQRLTELEKQLLTSYVKNRDEYVPRIQSDIAKLEKREHEFEDIEKTTTKLKEFGADVDFFLASRQVNEKLLEDEEIVNSSIENIRGLHIDFSINKDIESFISKLSKIGDFVVQDKPYSVELKRLIGVRKKPTTVTPVDDIKQTHIDHQQQEGEHDKTDIFKLKLVLRNKFAISKGFLNKDLCICNGVIRNGKIIFTDRENKRFIVTSLDGDHLHNMDVTGRPWGIANIDEARVVVTFPYIGSGYLEILDISNNKVEKAINIGGLCRGVSYNNGLIYVVVYGKGIQVVDMDGNVKTDIPVSVNGVFHMEASGERMYYTDEWTHTLHCRDLEGNEMWSFNDDRLKEPQGITTDENGNVYVASYLFDNVTVISADGQRHREILNKSDGLLGPSSVYYDKHNNFLLVSSREHGRVAIYHIL